ncbi:MAG: Smr/MutS family protein [Acidobacteria bacterium]|nr:Smr/MutS family protein [Acidobacteriota bacterium]
MDDEEPVRLPIEDVLDLHTFAPRDVKAVVEEYIEEAHRNGLRALRIIHGRGIGVQREMVRKVLERSRLVESFRDAPAEAGGWGATLVTLGDVTAATKKVQSKQTNSEFTAWAREYDAALADAEDLVKGLTHDQFNWRPGAGKWSIGECLDHLATSDRMFVARLSAAIEEARKQKRFAEGPFRYSRLQSWFLRSIEPPPRFRVKAPGGFAPKAGVYEPGITMDEFRKGNRELCRLALDAKGLDLVTVKVASPAASFWKWSIGIVIPLCVGHERRHLYQARQVKQSAGFPK